MDFKDHLEESGTEYSIFDISKTKIRHLPYSLRVLLENYVRNNKNASKDVLKKFESLHVNEKPKGLNPPASDSIANIWFIPSLSAISLYLRDPLKPFSSFINKTTLIVLLGL